MKSDKRQSAETVRILLQQAGLNQCEAARLIGVSPRTMRRYVSNDPKSCVVIPAPTLSLLTMVTDQLRAARSVRRQPQPRR